MKTQILPFSTYEQLDSAFSKLCVTLKGNKEFGKWAYRNAETLLQHPIPVDYYIGAALEECVYLRGTHLITFWRDSESDRLKEIFRYLFMSYYCASDFGKRPSWLHEYKVRRSGGHSFLKSTILRPEWVEQLIEGQSKQEVLDAMWERIKAKPQQSQLSSEPILNTGEVTQQIFVGDVNISLATIEEIAELVRGLRIQIDDNIDMVESSTYYANLQITLKDAIAVCCREIDREGKV